MIRIQFEYALKTSIKIKSLNTLGIVVGLYCGENGVQYQTAYFLNGERKTTYLYPEEIEKPSGDEEIGFMTK